VATAAGSTVRNGLPQAVQQLAGLLGHLAEQRQWLQKVWDAATEAGLRFLADVMKRNSLLQDYLLPLYTPSQPRLATLETGLFYNLLDAYPWLHNKQAVRP